MVVRQGADSPGGSSASAVQLSSDDVRDALQRVTSSASFEASGRLSEILRFLVGKTLAGEAQHLKEPVIAVEVFHRPPSYDPGKDAVVRVMAGRLRAKLEEYYEGAGRTDPIRIHLPKGSYVPTFARTQVPAQSGKAKRKTGTLALGSVLALAVVASGLVAIWVRSGSDGQPSRRAAKGQLPVAAANSNPVAYGHYERGKHFADIGTPPALRRAVDAYLLATSADPRFAAAYADLSIVYSRLVETDARRSDDQVELARVAAAKAIELDDSLAAAHHALARAHVAAWNWAAVEGEFLRTLELDPSNTSARLEYAGIYLILMGRHEHALEQVRHALKSAPASPGLRTGVGVCLLKAGRYDEAIRAFRESLDLREAPATLTFLGMALAMKGRHKEAIALQQRARSMSPEDPWIAGALGYTYAISGAIAEAKTLLRTLREMSSSETGVAVELAGIYSGLQQHDLALSWLSHALEAKSPKLRWLGSDVRFLNLHKDPRFQDILRAIGLPA